MNAGESGLSCQGFRTPLCAGIRCGCGAAAGRKASPKPEGFWRGRIGNYDTKTKEHSEWCAVLCAPANLRFAHAFFSAAIRRAAVLLRKTKKRTSGIQNPALRRDTVRLRRCGGAQSHSKARRLLEGFESGTMIPKENLHHRWRFSFGAPSGIRTRDPLIKSQLLYQLS